MPVTRHERLVQAYEDAYFDLLMEEVAEMEGAEWEMRLKELENDPSAVVPEEVDRKCRQTIERCFARKKRQKGLRIAGKALNRIAVFVAIVSMMITTVLAVSEDARVAAANLLITVNERYTEFHMSPSTATHSMKDISADEVLEDGYFSQFKVGWIPEEFSYIDGMPDMNAIFENKDGLRFIISKTDGDATLQIDTEDAERIGNIEINNCRVIEVCKNGNIQLVLINENKSLFVAVTASKGISEDVAIKIMSNIAFL